MTPAGFEPTVPASERPQTYALDGAATGIDGYNIKKNKKIQIVKYGSNA
jgi:hypothetical protein